MSIKKDHLTFSDKTDYKKSLKELKMHFNVKWKQAKPSPVINMDNFDKLAILGNGAFGTVRLVRDKSTNSFHAMKILIKQMIVKQKQVDHALNEKRILSSIGFPFVVSMEFSYKDNDCLYFGMPFISGGEMFTSLRKESKFSEPKARFYAAQVALGLEYLHSLNLIYRDLKPENILFDNRGYLKITDFGFCKMVQGRTWTLCGTPEYLAPELIQSKGYGKSADWWSYGILVFEMCAGFSPFYTGSDDHMVLFGKIVEGRFKMPNFFSRDLKNLIQHILQVDITKRYGNLKNGANDIKEHNWFRLINWINILNQEIEAPYIPVVKNPGDTSNFDKYAEEKFPNSTKCQYEKEFQDF